MMAEHFAFLLALTMVFAVTASVLAEGETYLWDNFDNLRAKNEDGALKLDFRPKAYDAEDYASEMRGSQWSH